MIRHLFFILFSFCLIGYPIQKVLPLSIRREEKPKKEEKASRSNEIFEMRPQVEKFCSSRIGKKSFKDLEKAEKCLKSLLKEREVLEGDFYGVNLTAYRYVNIFDRLNYIRYRIMQTDRKIKKVKCEIFELRKKIR